VFWIILYFFLFTIFFLYVVQFQMIWNFLSMYPTCLKEWIQRVTIILDIFLYKCGLVKCSCTFFRRAPKWIFVNSKANILQFTWWKILKFFSRLLKTVYYTILQFHVSKIIFFQKFGTCTRNGNSGAFFCENIVWYL